MASAESEALRHVFFAEREVTKVPGIGKSASRIEVETVGILGSGTMGTGIGIVFGNAGYTVRIIDPSRESLDKCKAAIEKTQASQVGRGRMDQATAADMLSRMSYVTSYDALADVDLAIEAVFEDMNLKKEIFAKLDEICKPGAILASNSSTLNIDDMAACTARPASVVGLHFFSPANIMKLLEIVRAGKTSKEVLATAVDIGKRIRKVAVVVGIGGTFGFVGNRMMVKGYIREADQMLLEGASVQEVDKAIYDFGLPMGPWTMNDMGGVDIMCSVLESTGARAANPEPFYNVTLALGEAGLLGQKTGQGFYRYEKGDRTPIYDPSIENIIAGEAERLNVGRKSLTADEIQQRCIFGLINEGARILEEGLVYRASDIDVIWIYGYGFPRFRGGPMFYADQIGPDKVYETVRGYHETLGNYWQPAPLLEQFAKEGRKFADWAPE